MAAELAFSIEGTRTPARVVATTRGALASCEYARVKTAPAVQPENTAIDWLLACPEPAVRRLARRDLLGQIADEDVLAGPWVRALLEDDEP